MATTKKIKQTLKQRFADLAGLLTPDAITTIVPDLVRRTDQTEVEATGHQDSANNLTKEAQALLGKADLHQKTAKRQKKAVDQVRRALN